MPPVSRPPADRGRAHSSSQQGARIGRARVVTVDCGRYGARYSPSPRDNREGPQEAAPNGPFELPNAAWRAATKFEACARCPRVCYERMDQFIAKHVDKLQGTLSCDDRVLFRGYLPFFSGYAMASFLETRGIRRPR